MEFLLPSYWFFYALRSQAKEAKMRLGKMNVEFK